MDYSEHYGARPGGVEGEGEFAATTNLYEYKDRPRRDTGFTVAYCVLMAVCVVWAIPVYTKMDPNNYPSDFYASATSCDIRNYTLATAISGQSQASNMSMGRMYNKAIGVWLPITSCLGVVCGAVYVLLFRKYAQTMVKVTVVSALVLALGLALLCLASGAVAFGVILLVVTVIMAICFFVIRSHLAMCGRLLTVAGRGLQENASLVPTALGIKVAGVGILGYLFAGAVCSLSVGKVQRNDDVLRRVDTGAPGVGICMDAMGNTVPCCEWKGTGWASFYFLLAIFAIKWTVALLLQLKVYVVADTIAQWYYAGTGVGNRGSVRIALRHAVTSSFGSIAFGAAILTLIRMVRAALERAARQNVICCIINCVCQPLLAMMEKFTKFATVTVAITGRSFVDAARTTYDMLKRNFLQTYSVWWIPEMVLSTSSMLFSLTWAALVFFSTYAQFRKEDDGTQLSLSFLVAFTCFFMFYFILYFVSYLLLDVVDTVYICYAYDRDRQFVTRPEVHAIYAEVPGICTGPVVEQPDGGVMYGAPDRPPQQVAMTSPQQPLYAHPAGYSAPAYPAYPPAGYSPQGYPPPAYGTGYPAVQPGGYAQPGYGQGPNNV